MPSYDLHDLLPACSAQTFTQAHVHTRTRKIKSIIFESDKLDPNKPEATPSIPGALLPWSPDLITPEPLIICTPEMVMPWTCLKRTRILSLGHVTV